MLIPKKKIIFVVRPSNGYFWGEKGRFLTRFCDFLRLFSETASELATMSDQRCGNNIVGTTDDGEPERIFTFTRPTL